MPRLAAWMRTARARFTGMRAATTAAPATAAHDTCGAQRAADGDDVNADGARVRAHLRVKQVERDQDLKRQPGSKARG
jgi:hypothetical protein